MIQFPCDLLPPFFSEWVKIALEGECSEFMEADSVHSRPLSVTEPVYLTSSSSLKDHLAFYKIRFCVLSGFGKPLGKAELNILSHASFHAQREAKSILCFPLVPSLMCSMGEKIPIPSLFWNQVFAPDRSHNRIKQVCGVWRTLDPSYPQCF